MATTIKLMVLLRILYKIRHRFVRCRHSNNKIIYGITLLTIFLFSDCIAIAHDIVIKIKAIAFDIRFSE